MQHALARIESRAAAVAGHPFLLWLDDDSLPAAQRLSAWLPEAAFFVFGFRDLNAEVLKYPAAEAAACPQKHAINRHLAEDATHWPWYLQDLKTLGLDAPHTLTSALRYLWGRDTVMQRRALYRLCALGGRAEAPAQRYALIAALEAVAHHLFGRVLPVARQYEAETGRVLSYLGPKHFEREPGHLTHQGGDDDALFAGLELDAAAGDQAWRTGEAVIELIEARWSEFHRVALVRTSAALTPA